MPALKNSKLPYVITAAVAILCGLALAALILWATGRGGGTRTYKPFNAGYEATLHAALTKGGPFFVPDPFGGEQGLWFALEDDKIVAIAVSQPDDPGCSIRWRGSVNAFVDCNDQPRPATALARYDVSYRGSNEGQLVYVDLQALLPPPSSIPPPR